MKPSDTTLGHEIQLYLVRQGATLELLAQQVGITQEALSNLIHGRRRFRDETLSALAQTPLFQQGGFSEPRLKALRAVDEYGMNELILAVAELVKRGQLETLPDCFFDDLRQEMARFATSNRSPLEKFRTAFGEAPP
ncbi:MAG: helix-turn-helix transcriptional regulator [Vampirovibrionales bacterium]